MSAPDDHGVSGQDDHGDGHDVTAGDEMDHDDHGHAHESYREQSGETRTTSPMQRFTAGEVGFGAVILLVGLAVAYLLPFLAVS